MPSFGAVSAGKLSQDEPGHQGKCFRPGVPSEGPNDGDEFAKDPAG